ncbi:MAG: YchJ family protein [Sulfuriflexus sp.]|nr:YchJ family protein [Sulfuriflexus sp.]
MSKSNTSACYCGKDTPFDACCGRIHDDIALADTAESLMRARFSAYSIDNLDFIRQSWHSTTCPSDVEANEDGFQWLNLEITDTTSSADDNEAEVEFIASYSLNGNEGKLHERSQFARENGQWRYIDGKLKKGAPVSVNKIGRNEPCPCGSGKKYKRCCL